MALTLSCSVYAKVKLFKSTLTTRVRCAVKQRRVPAKARYYKHPCGNLWKFVVPLLSGIRLSPDRTGGTTEPVSYTHLTLPTIYSV